MALCCLSLPLPLHFLGSNAKCTALLANANKEISANANANIKYLQMQMRCLRHELEQTKNWFTSGTLRTSAGLLSLPLN